MEVETVLAGPFGVVPKAPLKALTGREGYGNWHPEMEFSGEIT